MNCFGTFVFRKQRRLSHEILSKADERNGDCIMAWRCLNLAACWQHKRQLLSWIPFRMVPSQNGISFHEKTPTTAVILEFGAVKSCTAGFFQLSRAATTAAPTVVHCTLQGAGWIVVLLSPRLVYWANIRKRGCFAISFGLKYTLTDMWPIFVQVHCSQYWFIWPVFVQVHCSHDWFIWPVFIQVHCSYYWFIWPVFVQVHCSHYWFIWPVFVQVHCSYYWFIWPVFVQVRCSHDWFIWPMFVQVRCSHDWFIWPVFVQVLCSNDWFIWPVFVQVLCSYYWFIWPVFVQVHCSHYWFIWPVFVQVHCSHDWFIWSVFVQVH
jgi:hypothetical protein